MGDGNRPRTAKRGGTRSPKQAPRGLPSLEEGRARFLQAHKYHEEGSRADLNFRFTRKSLLFARRWRNYLNEHLSTIGQTQARWETLFWIAVSRGGATQRELAERVGIEGPTLARMLDRLEEEGLVERRTMRNDRRTKTIALKKAAQPRLKEISDLTDRLRADLLKNISAAELETCISVLDRILDKLERR